MRSMAEYDSMRLHAVDSARASRAGEAASPAELGAASNSARESGR
ncbi:MAG TPA: hypothetical protein VFR37_03945 [Longimicrobium sp.]|nr:hypothetical protein [Longimicrobium sp.]